MLISLSTATPPFVARLTVQCRTHSRKIGLATFRASLKKCSTRINLIRLPLQRATYRRQSKSRRKPQNQWAGRCLYRAPPTSARSYQMSLSFLILYSRNFVNLPNYSIPVICPGDSPMYLIAVSNTCSSQFFVGIYTPSR